jgi:hypothetical protein
MHVGMLVEHTGQEDHGLDPYLHHGSPGTVWDISRLELGEVYVTFVGGPSCCVTPDDLRPIEAAGVRAQGRASVRGVAPGRGPAGVGAARPGDRSAVRR